MKLSTVYSGISLLLVVMCTTTVSFGQTAATGALTGTVTDPTGAVVPRAQVTVTNDDTREARTVNSGTDGSYLIPLLPPGSYRVEATASGFKTATYRGIRINVTETTRLRIQLQVGALAEAVTVEAGAAVIQADTSSLGRVSSEEVVQNLPLVTRNYTQILGLSPGISANVTNAGELGRGSGGRPIARIYVHGSRAYDHNYQMDGIDVNDLESSAGGNTAGAAVPNPDAIQEFKVQTGQYDAAFGRNAGANVNVVTKGGSNEYHGTIFYFLRNEALNANDFFFNLAGTPKAELRQHQYGFTLAGPIKQEKWLFFGSYQGTRQTNGVAAGFTRAKCNSTIVSPPLTNDRSAATLGAMFAGRSGFNGGTAVLADGSNIHPVALQLLQMQLPDGGYLMPTPQVVDASQPFDRQGFSAFSIPCTFDEEQFVTNLDYLQSDKSKFAGRYFYATSDSDTSFPFFISNTPGSPLTVGNRFHVFSLAHTYVFSPRLFNEWRIGFSRNQILLEPDTAFRFSDIGVFTSSPPAKFDAVPNISITGSYVMAACCPLNLPQNTFMVQDHLSYVRGRHSLRFGGGLTRGHINVVLWQSNGSLTFLSFPDFLLGLDGVTNGSGFSNIWSSNYGVGPALDKAFRTWDAFAYLQDDFKVGPRLTLNLGLRYERLGHMADDLGTNTNFDVAQADRNPPAGGTLQGWVVPSNYPASSFPAGVIQTNNQFGVRGDGQNNFAPRIGFAWQVLPQTSRVVLRGGYGIHYTRTVGQTVYNTAASGPFLATGSRVGAVNASSTWSSPFEQPIPTVFPDWTVNYYSPTTNRSASFLAQDFRPPITQQYSLNLQVEVARDYLLEVGYVGARGTQLARPRSLNQAELASAAAPIRGETTNTRANLALRVPFQGWQAPGIRVVETAGGSWYNALEASLTKRFSRGLQFLASYTWAKSLDSDGQDAFNTHLPGAAVGDQNDWRQRYGRTDFDRTHRFVFSYVYELPGPSDRTGFQGKALSGWAVAGVTTLQSGQALTITRTNSNNIFGITGDRAQLASGCMHSDLVTSGSVHSKLNNYFNAACFTSAPVIGDDGIATAFGNSGVGIVNGPDQRNFDIALIKRTGVNWPNEESNFEFRAEFFNAFNTTQFDNPTTNSSSGAFGQITRTAVSPRIMQFALKFTF